ncbi:MAG: hypothetical protein R3224_03190, partial [Balneolaceae bacterium]|nr:hypothetical protein [Balneolaceae bacterium]
MKTPIPTLLLLLLLAITHGGPGLVQAQSQSRAQDGENRNYANTPEELLPYNRFQIPYMHFFDAPLPFRGEGRNRMPPEDLEAVAIGIIGPLEGSPNAEYGREMLNGVQLALEEANERGGYDGMPYKLLIRNDMG